MQIMGLGRQTAAALCCLMAAGFGTGSARAQIAACAGLATQAALNECAGREYKKNDAVLNDLYQQLRTRLRNPQQRAMLEEAERAWIGYRDRQCAFQTSGSAGGTIHPMIEADCLNEKTAVHIAELRRQLNCQEADPSCVHP